MSSSQQKAKAIFAGGCFWCTEAAFDQVEGVIETTSGYTGGREQSPSYRDVASGKTSHYEALEVVYDPTKVTYEELLMAYWHSIDPTDRGGQFADRGKQYRTAIFYLDEEQRNTAEESKKAIAKEFKAKIVTEILPAKEFFAAEEYHQDYHQKNKFHYNLYKHGSGRVKRLEELWGEKGDQ